MELNQGTQLIVKTFQVSEFAKEIQQLRKHGPLGSIQFYSISNDPNDPAALTPGHFLVGEPLTAQVDPSVNQSSTSVTSRWKVVSQIRHEF